MRKHRNQVRAGLIAAVTAAALTGTVTVASADDTAPVSEDAHTFNPAEEGLFELQAPSDTDGGIQVRNFTSSLSGWAPGSKESRHWADNDYTEVQFTGCTIDGATWSVGVKLWLVIPFAQDNAVGTKTFHELLHRFGLHVSGRVERALQRW
ncbi:hypothetical protein STENM223S_10401 [Streptomyces tendae]